MYDQVTIIGRMGGDPESRFTPGGKQVTNFSVATNSYGGDGSHTTWWRVSAWEPLAERCVQWGSKGKLVFVQGSIVSDENGGPRIWQRSDGSPGASFEITARVVRFLSGPSESDNEPDQEGSGGIPF